MKTILIFASALIIVGLLSWGLTVGVIKLITLCFGWGFSLSVATGIWLVLGLLGWVFNRGSSGK